MQIVIGNILSADELALIRATLAQATFEDGRATAGFAAQRVKHNLRHLRGCGAVQIVQLRRS